MSRTLRVMALVLPLCGCNEFQKTAKKTANPVGGEVPPRVANLLASSPRDEEDNSAVSPDASGTVQADAKLTPGDKRWLTAVSSDSTPLRVAREPRMKELAGGDVAATVNGRPIFVSEILDSYQGRLAKIEEQIEAQVGKLPASEIERRREELVQFGDELVLRDLPAYIRRELLVQGLTTKLKAEQRKQLDKFLDAEFDKHVEKILPEYRVSTRAELVVELQKRGESFDALRTSFRNQIMARQYVHMKTGDALKKEPTRQELLDYYREHIADYSYPAQVKWQQILILNGKHDGSAGAKKLANQVVSELRKGTDLAEVARKFSDGPNASDGGEWDWTREGSLTDKSVEKVLFELAVGKVSRPIETGKSIQLVRVLDRKPAGRTPFEQLQSEIQLKLQEAELKAAEAKVFADLEADADIRTLFDRRGRGPLAELPTGR